MNGIDPNQHALRIGMNLFKGRQPLAAAVVYAEVARSGFASAELWCGLAASLMGSRGTFVRKPFEVWAAKVLRRGEAAFAGTPYAEVVQDWLAELPDAPRTAPLADAEIQEMIDFLLVNEAVLTDAVLALPPDAAMGVVMALGDRKDPMYVPLLRAAVEGRLGDGAARSALKRIGPFVGRSDMQASLLIVSQSPMGEALGPYLGWVVDKLPAGWDGPRTSACPPYEWIGKIDVELVAAGTDHAATAAVLREKLGAAERDARSWVEHAPCVIKRGATRYDTLELKSALEPLGATLKLSGFTYSDGSKPHEEESSPPVEKKKPWWRFW